MGDDPPPAVVPPPLRPGDAVAVVAPASACDPVALARGLELLGGWGLRPEPFPSCTGRHGFLAARDADRRRELQAALDDERWRAVLCARGGYGTQRIVDALDLGGLRARPKLVVGFSDVTALHLAVGMRAGVASVHGPNVQWDDARTGPAAAEALRQVLFRARGVPIAAPATATVVVPGRAEGVLAGGNLSLLAASAGTPSQPDLRGRLLLLEEVGERPYRIDRMLLQLRRAGMLAGVTGVAVGECAACDDRGDADGLAHDLLTTFAEALAPLGVPSVYGLPLGHGPGQRPVLLGARYRLDDGGLTPLP